MLKKIPNPVDRHVGSRVRMRRMLIGMSQERLGEALGLTFQQVQKYEKGANRIGASRLQEIARILNVEIDYFFQGAPSTGDLAPSTGLSESPSPTYMADLLTTSEGVQLMKAFVQIADPKLRRRVVDLVAAIATDRTAASSIEA
jgi:transcriptional regulator with XRE-family HTH domain